MHRHRLFQTDCCLLTFAYPVATAISLQPLSFSFVGSAPLIRYMRAMSPTFRSVSGCILIFVVCSDNYRNPNPCA